VIQAGVHGAGRRSAYPSDRAAAERVAAQVLPAQRQSATSSWSSLRTAPDSPMHPGFHPSLLLSDWPECFLEIPRGKCGKSQVLPIKLLLKERAIIADG
jgi:hypothetical protein